MTPLTRAALATVPLKPDVVQHLHDCAHSIATSSVKALCVSHERLRMELEGAEKLLAEPDAKIKAALALTDPCGDEFNAAFPMMPVGWRVVVRIRTVLMGEK